jgi:hypothetical protein
MKKIYQTPNIIVVTINTTQIICTSLPDGGDAVTAGITSADAREAEFSDFEME